MSALLVAVEGIDGSGKTTLARALAAGLAARGVAVTLTREPTAGPWGARIRASALSGRMAPWEEARAFLEDRREHVRDVIAPALARGEVVVVDRYYFSSMAYQGARGLDPEAIRAENERVAPRPGLLILLAVDVPTALARVSARGAADLFERAEDLRRAAAIYDAVSDPAPLRLDAAAPPESLAEAAVSAVLRAMNPRGEDP